MKRLLVLPILIISSIYPGGACSTCVGENVAGNADRLDFATAAIIQQSRKSKRKEQKRKAKLEQAAIKEETRILEAILAEEAAKEVAELEARRTKTLTFPVTPTLADLRAELEALKEGLDKLR